MNNNLFYILSIDGGGLRGLFSAHLLAKLEQTYEIDWKRHFGLFAGTSTGAILAAGLASGASAETLLELYLSSGRDIFRPRSRTLFNPMRLFASRYSNKPLKRLLDDIFKEKTLGNLESPLIMPSVDIGNGCVHVLKSGYDKAFVRDLDVRVSDAVLASCSAPTYFDPFVVGPYQLVDGGLWANNPSLIAAIDAHHRLKIQLDRIRVLSLGTGKISVFYPRNRTTIVEKLTRNCMGWGLATRWGGSKLIDLILNLQPETAHNTLCLLLGGSLIKPKRVLRLTFESNQTLPLDSAEKQEDWLAKADQVFSHQASRIANFLAIERRSK